LDDWEVLNKEPYGSARTTTDNNRDDDSFNSGDNRKTDDFFGSWDQQPTVEEKRPSAPRSQQRSSNSGANLAPAASEDATKKFGNAKSISSDQYFCGNTVDYETKTNLAKYEGSTGIGSDDLFGNGTSKSSSAGYGSYASQVPEMAEIKDSVRQGVTKVAGKLANMSSSVGNYFSYRYS